MNISSLRLEIENFFLQNPSSQPYRKGLQSMPDSGSKGFRERIRFRIDLIAFFLSIFAVFFAVISNFVERRGLSVIVRDAVIDYEARTYSGTFIFLNSGTQDLVLYAPRFRASRHETDVGCRNPGFTPSLFSEELPIDITISGGEMEAVEFEFAFSPALNGGFQICVEIFAADFFEGVERIRFPAGFFRANNSEGNWEVFADEIEDELIVVVPESFQFRRVGDLI